jgi:hypothetical protein
MGFFLGKKTYATIVHQTFFDCGGFKLPGLTILVLLIAWRGKYEARYLLFVGFGSLAIALGAPIGSDEMPQWRALWSIPGFSQRYYLIPMAMLLFALAAMAGHGKSRPWRGLAGALLLLVTAMGARIDWVLPPLTDFHFAHYANLYRELPPGASIEIPINPRGWQMKLRKPLATLHH